MNYFGLVSVALFCFWASSGGEMGRNAPLKAPAGYKTLNFFDRTAPVDTVITANIGKKPLGRPKNVAEVATVGPSNPDQDGDGAEQLGPGTQQANAEQPERAVDEAGETLPPASESWTPSSYGRRELPPAGVMALRANDCVTVHARV